jgi:methyltransferase (TIGR00027 family)
MTVAGVLTSIADTAHWVAYLRALESERADALFRDRFARRLAGELGERIATRLPSATMLWSLAIRTRVYDDWILDAIARERVTTVVNLAAGLDARPYRLALPASLRWVELDLPAIIDEKQQLLASERAACVVERIGIDLADRAERRALFARLRGAGQPILLIAEGLLMYLDEDAVAALAEDLRAAFAKSIWLLENVAPSILALQHKLFGEALRSARADHKFAPAGGWEFFQSRGWTSSETRSLFDEGRRFGREPFGQKLARWFTPRRYERLRRSVEYAIMRPEG